MAQRADRGVEGVADDREADRPGAGGGVEQLGGVDRGEVGDRLLERVAAGLREVVADDEAEVVGQPAGELLQLEAEEAAVGAELHDVVGDLVLDPAHHLEALEDVGDVADGDEVLDLERRGAGDLVEARLVALERLQRLVGTGQDRAGVLEDDAAAGDRGR